VARGGLAGLAGAGLVILVVALLVAAFADFIAPRGDDDQDLAFALQPPAWAGGTWANPLGTDPLGRDVLSRVIYGARTSLLLALGSVREVGIVLATLPLAFAGGAITLPGHAYKALVGAVLVYAAVQLWMSARAGDEMRPVRAPPRPR